MNPWEKKKWLVVVGIVLACVGGSLYLSRPQPAGENIPQERVQQEKRAEEKTLATVYISGAVNNPGLHQVEPGIRFQEALEKAGGVTADADLTKVNLAKKCKDGMQINVPFVKAKKAPEAKTQQAAGRTETQKTTSQNFAAEKMNAVSSREKGGRINLNRATAAELESLPGIGPALAARIVAHRNKTPFRRVEDLQKVSGIGPAKFLKLREHVEV